MDLLLCQSPPTLELVVVPGMPPLEVSATKSTGKDTNLFHQHPYKKVPKKKATGEAEQDHQIVFQELLHFLVCMFYALISVDFPCAFHPRLL